MKKHLIPTCATITALVFLAFTKPKQLDTPDCTSIIHYFKVPRGFTDCDLAAQNALIFPIPNDPGHVDDSNSAGHPFTCNNVGTEICCIGYDSTEVQLNPATNKWELKSGKTPLNYRCCVKHSS